MDHNSMEIVRLPSNNTTPRQGMNASADLFVIATLQAPAFLSVQILLGIFDVLGVLVNVLVLILLRLQTGQHVNNRLVMGNMSLAAILFNVSQFGRTVNYFVHLDDLAALASTKLNCALEEAVAGLCRCAAIFTVVCTALERLIAIRNHASYERSKAYLGAGFVAVCWLQAAFVTFIFLAVIDDKQQKIPYCNDLLNLHVIHVGVSAAVYVACGTASAVVYVIVVRRTRRLLLKFRKNCLDLSLSSRHQINQNVDITHTLIPVVAFHYAAWLFAEIYAVTIASIKYTEIIVCNFAVCSALFDLIVSAYFLVHPILLIYRSTSAQRKFMEAILGKLPCLRGAIARWKLSHGYFDHITEKASNASEAVEEAYLESLRAAWGCIDRTQPPKSVSPPEATSPVPLPADGPRPFSGKINKVVPLEVLAVAVNAPAVVSHHI